MKYRNAQDIFPEDLLKQIQRYVSGETIYIPAGNGKRSWGETSGYQQFIRERNAAIKADFEAGQPMVPPQPWQVSAAVGYRKTEPGRNCRQDCRVCKASVN